MQYSYNIILDEFLQIYQYLFCVIFNAILRFKQIQKRIARTKGRWPKQKRKYLFHSVVRKHSMNPSKNRQHTNIPFIRVRIFFGPFFFRFTSWRTIQHEFFLINQYPGLMPARPCVRLPGEKRGKTWTEKHALHEQFYLYVKTNTYARRVRVVHGHSLRVLL